MHRTRTPTPALTPKTPGFEHAGSKRWGGCEQAVGQWRVWHTKDRGVWCVASLSTLTNMAIAMYDTRVCCQGLGVAPWALKRRCLACTSVANLCIMV